MTGIVFRRLWALGVLVAVMAGLPGLALADTRSELQARYNVLAAAMSSGNSKAAAGLLAPGFEYVDINGRPKAAKAFVAMVGPPVAHPKFKMVMTVVSVTGTADAATVEQKLEIADPATGKVIRDNIWIIYSQDVWKKVKTGWVLQSMHQDKADRIADGKVVMHRDGIPRVVRPLPAETTFPDMGMGNPNAKVTVIQYGSVACPVCARVQETVMPAFIKKYVDTGKVYYIYRPMMTGNAAVATAGHLLAECAGKDKYFNIVDEVMRAQGEMDKGGPPEQYVNAHPVLARIARDAGLSDQQFETCIGDQAGIARMGERNQTYMDRDGMTGTPTFLVNGNEMGSIPMDISFFDKALAPLLK